jgi:hypothetical protein
LFQKFDIDNEVMKGAFLSYKLIGNVTYPMRPWFYSSVRKKDCKRKATNIGISYNLEFQWWWK